MKVRFGIALFLILVLVQLASSQVKPERPKLQLVTNAWHAYYRASVPDSDDGILQELRDKAVYYDESVMPRAYQFWEGPSSGVHSAYYNISAVKPQEQLGNANREFPWNGPAGTDPNRDNTLTFKFFVIPEGQRVAVGQGYAFNGDTMRQTDLKAPIHWDFPVGTVFGEVIQIKQPKTGDRYTVIVRTRKLSESGWVGNEYRPYGSPEDLAAKVQKAADSRKISVTEGPLQSFFGQLRQPRLAVRQTYDQHRRVAFNAISIEEKLAPLPDEVVISVLQNKFTSARGQVWRESEGRQGFAPSTDAAFHVVPTGYFGHAIEVSKNGCLKCHDTVMHRAREFDQPRDWYGQVRGGGSVNGIGIFSWHPFDPNCVAPGGIPQAVEWRREFVAAGILEDNPRRAYPAGPRRD